MNLSHFITKTATARILAVSPNQVYRVEMWASVVWVHIVGRRPRFVSFTAYRRDFLSIREVAAKQVALTLVWSNEWRTATGHTVSLNSGKARCNCTDFVLQRVNGNGKAICKHTIAAKEYVKCGL